MEHVAQWHAANGGRLLMVTLTLRHTQRDGLGRLVDGLVEAWRRVQQGAGWREDVRPFLSGIIRALEVTHGWTDDRRTHGGWHPHLHLLLLVPGDVDVELLGYVVRDVLREDWSTEVVRQLGAGYEPSTSIGVDVREVGADAARYVSKISMEVTRSDLKSGGRDVWSLIDQKRWRKFAEYATAMRGKRAVQFSRGLRAAAGLGDVEPSDEELALDLEDGLIVAWFEPRTWNRYERSGTICDLLESIEARCRAVRIVEDAGRRVSG